jgi:hypothetical protein
MKYLKKFNESTSITENQVEDYLKSQFTSEWFDSELSERVYDYISDEDAEDYDGDLVETYKNLSTGCAIEYDLLELMSQEASNHFNIPINQKIESRSISDICHDHLMDTCTWFDKWIFDRRSTEPYKSKFGGGYEDLMKNIDW